MILTFYFLYKYRIKKNKEYDEYYPKLLDAINQNNTKKALELLKVIMWNPNMIKHRYIEVQKLMSHLDDHDPKYKELILMIDKVYEKRGWNA